MKHTLYGISTGPGDPELLTLRAVRTLEACHTIAAPDSSTAFDIAEKAVSLDGKVRLPLHFPMTAEEETVRTAHAQIADLLCHALEEADTALLCLGDLSLYASFPPVAALVAERGYPVQRIPGVPSFCAAAALAGVPLASGNQPLQILTWDSPDLASRLTLPGGKLLLKCGSRIHALRELLRDLHLLDHAYAVLNCGMPGEQFCPQLRDLPESCGYFTIVYIAP